MTILLYVNGIEGFSLGTEVGKSRKLCTVVLYRAWTLNRGNAHFLLDISYPAK